MIRWYKIAAYLLIGLGVLHELIEAMPKPNEPEMQSMIQTMKNFDIDFLETISAWDYMLGYSFMMGFLFIVWGVNLLVNSNNEEVMRKSLYINTFGVLIAFLLSLRFFHYLAYGWIAIVGIILVTLSIKQLRGIFENDQ